jgi:hypothetical protein
MTDAEEGFASTIFEQNAESDDQWSVRNFVSYQHNLVLWKMLCVKRHTVPHLWRFIFSKEEIKDMCVI